MIGEFYINPITEETDVEDDPRDVVLATEKYNELGSNIL